MNCLVVHYSEIGTKKSNREFFENKLTRNIRSQLRGTGRHLVRRLRGRIMIGPGKGADRREIALRLRKVPGISHFSFAHSCGPDVQEIKEALEKMAEGMDIRTFAIDAARSDKSFSHTSTELNEMLGDFMRKKFRWKVDLSKPDARFFVEVAHKIIFVYTEKIRGIGGLPVSTGGKLVCLMSGGIDSPVAAFSMMKRGCHAVLVHFHNLTGLKDAVENKVERIAGVLSGYQPRTKLYLVPFGDIQKQIIMKVPADSRMIVYRRMMFSIAGRIAEREGALGLVTGDSVGQVASQTLENLNVIYGRADLPVFTPLIGMNKEEIIRKAEEIGTYALSVLPYSDCCSYFVAKHPETRAKAEEIEGVERNLDVDGLAAAALEKVKVRIFPASEPASSPALSQSRPHSR